MTATITVDVQNKCRNTKRCKCQGNKRHVSVRTGTLGETKDYGYCTHEINSEDIRDTQISTVFWQNVELERIGFSSLLTNAIAVTVFYHRIYDYDPQLIKKPLLIRAKDNGNKTHWLENVGSYANKRWRRLDASESEDYPEGDKYSNIGDFEGKLKALSCMLFVSHRIHIDFAKGNYDITCEICGEKLEIKVQQDPVKDADGYTKYNYSGKISDNSILVYNGRQLTFQKRLRYKTGYYLPIPVDKDNFNIVSAYYWEKDNDRKNPLLIEFSGENNISYWIENISSPGKDGKCKHDKWRPLPWRNNPSQELKSRLDVLNCIYNGVVQIRVGEPGDCHDKKHFLHSKRIYYLYSENYGTYPVVFSYKYLSSLGTSKPYNISEIYVEGKIQKFETNILPFTKVTRFTIFVSPCFNKKPFLLCVESGERDNCKWYKRKPGNTWEYYPQLLSGYDRAQGELGALLRGVSNDLDIGPCNIPTGADGVRLDIKQTPGHNHFNHIYQGEYGQSKSVSIFVTKSGEDLVYGFFKNSHKPPTRSGTFVLDRTLKDDSKIGATTKSDSKISNVKNFFVYFWNANPDAPILLGVKEDNKNDTKYYGTLGTNWSSNVVEHMNEQQALDHQNCMVNKAIPIELTDPTNLERFKATNNPSSCLKYKSVEKYKSPKLPTEAEYYKVDSYNISDNGIIGTTRISRVTYNKQSTNITTTNVISQLRIYKWNKDTKGIPLLVELSDSNQSTFFENLGKDPDYREWKKVGRTEVETFYSDQSNPSTLTDKFTTKLDEVNCNVNKIVQLDISEKGGKYCHGIYAGHEKRINVSKEQVSKYSGFIGYEHAPAKDQKTLTISSIYNGKDRQKLGGFTMPKEVTKVTVYLPECPDGTPVAIKFEYEGDKGNDIWLRRETTKDEWTEATQEFKGKSDQEIQSILDNVRDTINACKNSLPSPIPRFIAPKPPHIQGSEPSELKYDQYDKKFTWDDLITDAEKIEDEEKQRNGVSIDTQREYEDEELVEEQAEITLAKTPVTGSTVSKVPRTANKALPSVIIDIHKDDTTRSYTFNTGKKVKLSKEENPSNSNFYMIIHEAYDGVPFKVEKVTYRNEKTIHTTELGIKDDEEIIHLAVWYWKSDSGMKNPLLIEVLKENGEHIYRLNNGNLTWKELHDGNSELTGEKLERILDDLNCKHNDAVTMDLTEEISKNKRSYCCSHHDDKKIPVEKRESFIEGVKFTDYYKHQINIGLKLAKIKYYPKNTPDERKGITTKELDFPINGAVSVYVFYCNNKPVLIYVDSTSQKRWYRRKDQNNHVWELLLNKLNGTDPDNIKGCDDVKKIKDVLGDLGCIGLKDCDMVNNGKESPRVITTTVSNQKVTIKLSEKRNDEKDHTYQDSVSGKKIKVTRSSYPTRADFFKFIHTHNGPSFSLKQVQDDNQTISGTDSINEKVTSVSAYYWTGNTKNALLVEVVKEDGKHYYYARNSKNGNWESYQLEPKTPEQLLQKLTLLNCEINDVVQIDVSKTEGSYCHEYDDLKHYDGNKKVKVEKVGNGQLGNYIAFEHTPTEGRNFNISGLTNGQTPITLSGLHLPVMKATKVIVYFCGKEVIDTKDSANNPLLIYVPNSEADKWFKKPLDDSNNIWSSIFGVSLKDDANNKNVIDFLDTLESPCKAPVVTIDLYERFFIGSSTEYYGGTSGKLIDVYGFVSKETPEFTEYNHTVKDITNSYFTVTDFEYNGKNTYGIRVSNPLKNVRSVSVYYWTPLEAPGKTGDERGRPLLVKVTIQGLGSKKSTELYYENIGIEPTVNTDWNIWTPIAPTKIVLEKKLHLLNCKLNDAVVIDVSKSEGPYDACNENDKKTLDPEHGNDNMKVEKDNAAGQTLEKYSIYKHSLKNPPGGKKFHIVGFKNEHQEISIGHTSHISPILDVDLVKVYRCDIGNRSLLFYYNTDSTHNWYKNPSGETPGKWEEETSVLSNSISSEDYEKILQVLNTLESKCKSPAKESHTAQLSGVEAGLGATMAAWSWSAFGASSGTVAGAGSLTGFGLWMFKRSKGDPWVRQI